MIPKLSNSSRFVEDYKNLQKRIAAVNDAGLQRQLTEGLLKTKEFRESISKQRKILENKLVEFEKRQTVTPALHSNEE